MCFSEIPGSTDKRCKYLKFRYLAIATGILLSGCGGSSGGGGEDNNRPQPDDELPMETSAAVWGESNWDQVNWQ